MLETAPGFCLLDITGQNSYSIFSHEAGGHRWQRVPPTERQGRVHTSTITVATLGSQKPTILHIDSNDLRISACRGSGPRGQNRNKTNTFENAWYHNELKAW